MNLLIDTHIFIWLQISLPKISSSILSALENEQNTIFLSLVSIWEIQIKAQAGKLDLPDSLTNMIATQQQNNGLRILPIRAEHIYNLENLPFHHKDPFDRLLISQALIEDFTLVSDDENFPAYNVKLL